MRDIKFRAWDKKKNDWFDDNCGVLYIELNGNINFGWNGEIMDDYTDRIILMQYTGLKDVNNVEIFEGDIVKRTYLDGMFGRTHIGEVVYDKVYARYIISKPQKYTEPKTEDIRNTLSDRNTYEVIGNIHNNPDLLGED